MRKGSWMVLVVLAGCGGEGSKDEGPAFRQRGYDDAISAAMTAYREVADDTWEARAIDHDSCVADPAPDGNFCPLSVQVVDFEESRFLVELGGTTVKVFPANRIDDINAACVAPGTVGACGATPPVCFVGTADAQGRIDFPCLPCNTRYAAWTYKESMIPVTKKAAEFHRWIDATTGVEDVFTISVKTYNLIPGIVGFQPDPALGIVAGEANDCGRHSLENVAVNIERGRLSEPISADFSGDDPIYGVGTFYFVNEFPQKQQSLTSPDGLWAFVNVPPAEVTVFASGRRSAGGAIEENVGRVTFTALPDTITIGDLLVEGP